MRTIDGRKSHAIEVSGPFQIWRDVIVQALMVTGFCVAIFLVFGHFLAR